MPEHPLWVAPDRPPPLLATKGCPQSAQHSLSLLIRGFQGHCFSQMAGGAYRKECTFPGFSLNPWIPPSWGEAWASACLGALRILLKCCSDAAGLGRGPRFCMSNKLLGGDNATHGGHALSIQGREEGKEEPPRDKMF